MYVVQSTCCNTQLRLGLAPLCKKHNYLLTHHRNSYTVWRCVGWRQGLDHLANA